MGTRKKAFICMATLLFTLTGGLRLSAAEPIADTVYHKGVIYTMTESREEAKDISKAKRADVVATKAGKIVFVGSEADAMVQGYLDANKVGSIVDLKGKTMLPGFVDGHSHFPGQGYVDLSWINLNSPPLGPMTSIDDILQEIKARTASLPAGTWIQGKGYDDSLLKEKRHITREELDQVSSDHPIYLMHSSGHMAVANSVALSMADQDELKKNEQVVKKPGTDEPTGLLLESAQTLISALIPPSTDKYLPLKYTSLASQIYGATGVTTADQGGSQIYALDEAPFPMGFYTGTLSIMQDALAAGIKTPRVVAHPLNTLISDGKGGTVDVGRYNRKALGWTGEDYKDPSSAPQVGDDLTNHNYAGGRLPDDIVLFGNWKMVYDGSNQGYTGYFKDPGYYDVGTNPEGYDGRLGVASTDGKIQSWIKFYHSKGQPVAVHTNGNRAAEEMISTLEEAVAETGASVTDMRHTLIHAQMLERQHIERMMGDYAELAQSAHMYKNLKGIYNEDGTINEELRAGLHNGKLIQEQHLTSSYFINHTYFWGDRHMDIFMGPGRAKNMNPAGWSAAYGQPFSLHNDTTVTPISPLRSLESAVTRLAYQTETLISGSGKDLNATAVYAETKGGEQKTFWDYDQRINVLQALHALTIDGAYQYHQEKKVGSIAEGKYADFVVLDENPFDVAAADPRRLDEIRVTTTIVGDVPLYGFLPDSKNYVGQFAVSYIQPDGVWADNLVVSTIEKDEAEKNYAAIPTDLNRLGTYAFSANVPAGKSCVFQFNFLGNGSTAAEHHLYKLSATKSTPYTYGKPVNMENASGQWWIADFTSPLVPLSPDAVLTADKAYVAFLIIHDNDTLFDADPAEGRIVDPVSLVTSGSLPNNGVLESATGNDGNDGNGSSGCTVGSAPAYDLLVLFLGLFSVAVLRTLRRKQCN